MTIREVAFSSFTDQKPGTAGLRKKVTIFQQPHYLESFVQAIFDTLKLPQGATLVLGGDARYYNREAIQIIISMSAANGIGHLIIGTGGLLSTPAASHIIRCRHAAAGIILTASHNPGGPDGDFGIKFNTASGGQAPEHMTDAVYARTLQLTSYRIAALPMINLDTVGTTSAGTLKIEIIDPVDDYAQLMEQLFDFELIGSVLRKKTRLYFDALNAATGPYAQKIFCDILGAPANSVQQAIPMPDFGGLHPDPNPVEASHLVDLAMSKNAPDLIAASDGDGDRNMILGPGLVVSPGDSLAIMLANTAVTPGYRNDVKGVARSMPTSRAVDLVAEQLNIPFYETPTGWRFFCNLLEAGKITFCGEESFGTSSAHTREKDGLWAVLYWLNMIAVLDQSVQEIVSRHWQRFGRVYFQRRDFFIADTANADALMAKLTSHVGGLNGKAAFGSVISNADIFSYTDPIDGSISNNQGIRVYLEDGGRIVYRLSGTGTAGATLRVYLDKIERNTNRMNLSNEQAFGTLATAAAAIADIEHFTGLRQPTAII